MSPPMAVTAGLAIGGDLHPLGARQPAADVVRGHGMSRFGARLRGVRDLDGEPPDRRGAHADLPRSADAGIGGHGEQRRRSAGAAPVAGGRRGGVGGTAIARRGDGGVVAAGTHRPAAGVVTQGPTAARGSPTRARTVGAAPGRTRRVAGA